MKIHKTYTQENKEEIKTQLKENKIYVYTDFYDFKASEADTLFLIERVYFSRRILQDSVFLFLNRKKDRVVVVDYGHTPHRILKIIGKAYEFKPPWIRHYRDLPKFEEISFERACVFLRLRFAWAKSLHSH